MPCQLHSRPQPMHSITSLCETSLQGIWGGMIGGTAIQTLILAIITARCDWEKEVSNADRQHFQSSCEHYFFAFQANECM